MTRAEFTQWLGTPEATRELERRRGERRALPLIPPTERRSGEDRRSHIYVVREVAPSVFTRERIQ